MSIPTNEVESIVVGTKTALECDRVGVIIPVDETIDYGYWRCATVAGHVYPGSELMCVGTILPMATISP